MEEILRRIILENQELIAQKELVVRDYHIPDTENITVLTGIRRCGKTHILYKIAQSLPSERVLFLDFEDERLIALNARTDYDIITDSYKILYPDVEPVLFFDEIQNLSNWHFYLRRLRRQGYKIYVSGSNADLISREIATYLKGISLETSIHPFSFAEFLDLKGIEIKRKDFFLGSSGIVSLFEEYLHFGGFPEVIKAEETDKRAFAKNIYSLLFYKDLVVKYDKDEYLVRLILSKIAENITKSFSISSLARKIMSVYKTSIPTVTDYFNILPEPYLTYNIYQFRTSFVQREARRKTYLADNSFLLLNRIGDDRSRYFENLVFNYLQRTYSEVHYYVTRDHKEVDFLINGTDQKMLIQASVSISHTDTRNREISSLHQAMKELEMSLGYIYTINERETLSVENATIEILPFWREALQTVSK